MRFKSTLEEVAEMEGEQRGLEKGRLTAKQDDLIRLVRRRFGVTQDDERVIRAVADLQALDGAIDAVIDAESKDQVLALLPAGE